MVLTSLTLKITEIATYCFVAIYFFDICVVMLKEITA